MRFYTNQHPFYCGIDLHARLLAICIVDHAGAVVLQTQIPADKQLLLQTLAPYRPNVVIAVECLFAWYWVADLCAAEKIPFVLGQTPGADAARLASVCSDPRRQGQERRHRR